MRRRLARSEPVWGLTAPLLNAAVRLAVPTRVVGIDNLPRRGPVLVAANHVSHLDPVVLLTVAHRAGRKLRFLAVEEAFTKPISGWLLRAGRHIPVAAGAHGIGALRWAREALTAGEAVLVYPEGTIPGTDRDVPARAGIGFLALITGAPVIPVGSAGLERWRYPRRHAAVVVSRPVDLTGLPAGRLRLQAAYVSNQILEEVRRSSAEAGELLRRDQRSSGRSRDLTS